MNFFRRDKETERRITELEGWVKDLREEVDFLRRASTMRVGEDYRSAYGSYLLPDRRPILTAMDAVQKLMADAGIEPKPVSETKAHVQFVQADKS